MDSSSRQQLESNFRNEGRYLIGKTAVGDNLKESIKASVDLIGGFKEAIEPGDTVTIKPNLNTADPYPASSDPEFIRNFCSD